MATYIILSLIQIPLVASLPHPRVLETPDVSPYHPSSLTLQHKAFQHPALSIPSALPWPLGQQQQVSDAGDDDTTVTVVQTETDVVPCSTTPGVESPTAAPVPAATTEPSPQSSIAPAESLSLAQAGRPWPGYYTGPAPYDSWLRGTPEESSTPVPTSTDVVPLPVSTSQASPTVSSVIGSANPQPSISSTPSIVSTSPVVSTSSVASTAPEPSVAPVETQTMSSLSSSVSSSQSIVSISQSSSQSSQPSLPITATRSLVSTQQITVTLSPSTTATVTAEARSTDTTSPALTTSPCESSPLQSSLTSLQVVQETSTVATTVETTILTTVSDNGTPTVAPNSSSSSSSTKKEAQMSPPPAAVPAAATSSSTSTSAVVYPSLPATLVSVASFPTGQRTPPFVTMTGPTSAPPVSVTTVVTTVISVSTTSFTTTLFGNLTTSQAQTATMQSPSTATTTIHTSLSTTQTQPPFNATVVPSPTTAISPITTGTAVISSTTTVTPTVATSSNIFVPVASGAPPAQIQTRGNHPVPRLSVVPSNRTIQTNKFYANFFLGHQNASTWTHPYSVAWTNNGGVGQGLAVSHVDPSRRVYGPGDPPQYFINPLGLYSVIMSAVELGPTTNMTLDSLAAFSVNVNLSPAPGAAPFITFPIVQGMGFVTGVYQQATPQFGSTIFFNKLVYLGVTASESTTVRYQVTLMDGTIWMIYMTPNAGYSVPTLTLLSSGQIAGNAPFSGIVQVAKNPNGAAQNIATYDRSAGTYVTTGVISASVDRANGNYTFAWSKAGQVTKPLLMWALPHHQQSFANTTTSGLIRDLQLATTTKGNATAIAADVWNLRETNLPYNMDFAPWTAQRGSQKIVSAEAARLIANVSSSELAQDFDAQTNLDSMYFAGKGLAKFAFTVYAASEMANATGVASAGLMKLKTAFDRFVQNRQINPLVYDNSWGGIVSTAGYSNNGADFGNTYYNDHHFHYGYFVYTAAVIGTLDPSWLNQGTNKAWVNMLIRDYANSDPNDQYYPFSRMYDWFHGHSWAHGLYETADGKDEESSSEDAFSSYALKMWGKTIGDPNLEARGNLMLSVTARSLGNYFLLQSDNAVQPAQFLPNKAAGIVFENKIDHTTYFGRNPEYIEGIHMLPLNPSSVLTRSATFVIQEWDRYFSNGRVDQVAGGWRGILYANLALVDPRTAYRFFADPNFSNQYLDGGASRTWYLAFCAGLGGA